MTPKFMTPWVGGRAFFSPYQKDFRNKQLGFWATGSLGTHARARLLRRHDTGSATIETLEPDGDMWRQVTGSWGQLRRAGKP